MIHPLKVLALGSSLLGTTLLGGLPRAVPGDVASHAADRGYSYEQGFGDDGYGYGGRPKKPGQNCFGKYCRQNSPGDTKVDHNCKIVNKCNSPTFHKFAPSISIGNINIGLIGGNANNENNEEHANNENNENNEEHANNENNENNEEHANNENNENNEEHANNENNEEHANNENNAINVINENNGINVVNENNENNANNGNNANGNGNNANGNGNNGNGNGNNGNGNNGNGNGNNGNGNNDANRGLMHAFFG